MTLEQPPLLQLFSELPRLLLAGPPGDDQRVIVAGVLGPALALA